MTHVIRISNDHRFRKKPERLAKIQTFQTTRVKFKKSQAFLSYKNLITQITLKTIYTTSIGPKENSSVGNSDAKLSPSS